MSRASSALPDRIVQRMDCSSGAAAVEFALLMPMLLLMLIGIFVFGIAISNYIVVTGSAQAAGLQLSISRGTTAPWTDTLNQVYASAAALTRTNLTVTLSVNGVACASDAACKILLSSNAGQAASATVTYSCSLLVLGRDYAPSCRLHSTATGRIQ